MKMKDSEVYLKAAMMIQERLSDYSCFAIANIFDTFWECYPLSRDYCRNLGFFGALDIELAYLNNELGCSTRDFRVLLLCLAAAIAESEGR